MADPTYIVELTTGKATWASLAASYTWTQLQAYTWSTLPEQTEDISKDVLRVVISRSHGDPIVGIQAGQVDIVLDNKQDIYSPTNSLSPYYGTLTTEARITVKARTDAGSVYPLFSGKIDAIHARP